MRFLLVGNYGVGNLGDEALKEYFLHAFPQVEWKVLSANPKQNELPRFPAGVRSFFSFQWLKTLRSLLQSDGMVFGGGSLFTDVESWQACWLWWCQAVWAWLFRKKIILAFQGVGPHKSWIGKVLTRWVVKRADYISVRDEHSYKRVNEMHPKIDVIQSFDPVFSLIKKQEYDVSAQENLIVIPRKNSDDHLQGELQKLLKTGRWRKVLCVSLQPGNKSEREYIVDLRADISQPFEVLEVRTLDELTEAVAQGSFVLTQRYHGAIVALALGRELQVIPQEADDKIASIQQIIANIPLKSRKQHLTALVQAGESSLQKILS